MTEVKALRPVVGVEIGQGLDPAAICVAQPERRKIGRVSEVHFTVRHLERLDPDAKYPQVAERLQEVVAGIHERAGRSPIVYINTTGRGRPLHDFFRRRVRKARIIAVSFNHGAERLEKDGAIILGTAYVVSQLQVLLQPQPSHLHLPKTPEVLVLTSEIRNFKIPIDERADERLGTFRVGTLHDLVIALGLAVQTTPREPIYPSSPPYVPSFNLQRGLSARSGW